MRIKVQQSAEAAGALAGPTASWSQAGALRVTMATDLDVMAPFLAEFGEVPAIVLEVDVSARFVDLVGENFDVALRLGPLRDDATLAARYICDLCGGLYASPAYLKEADSSRPGRAPRAPRGYTPQRRTGTLSNGFYSAVIPLARSAGGKSHRKFT